ncbi:Lipase, GDSL [Heracleum sosnowskyi]|uniref:Lipase, GDSL n=1 Tax=Heracleum sosnowskyi TaxID=360622 RepID=A0AAD8M070_9APIA|nr:Lipase, GDSL [Heracleum sosnowskyi]
MGNSSLNLSSRALLLFLVLSVAALLIAPRQAHTARTFFVFGDSLVDNGNNDYLATTTRADSPPYGIDYPTHHPTGRFSNGLNIPDLIKLLLGASSHDSTVRGQVLWVLM